MRSESALASLVFVALFMGGCGPALEDGDYRVEFTKTKDTCGTPGFLDDSTTEWKIGVTDEEWKITNTSNAWIALGKERDGLLLFDKTASSVVNGCMIIVDDHIELTPDGDAFKGTMDEDIRAQCDGSMCGFEWTVKGTLK